MWRLPIAVGDLPESDARLLRHSQAITWAVAVAGFAAYVGLDLLFQRGVPTEQFEVRAATALVVAVLATVTLLRMNLRRLVEHTRAREAAYNEADAARQRAEVLARASDLLAQSLDYPTTLRQVGDLVVASLASYCTIDLLTGDGALERLLATGAVGTDALLAQQLAAYPPQTDSRHPAWRVLQSGEPLLLPDLPEPSDDVLASYAQDAAHLPLMRRLDVRAMLIVPLQARGRILGTMQLLWDGSHPLLDAVPPSRAQDEQHELVLLAQALADRAAVAIDNARLYAEAQNALAAREAALADRDALLASVAHDLRNPLGTIKLAAQTARRELPLARPTDQAHSNAAAVMLAKVDVLTRRMDGYIQELVDATALQQGGQLTLDREPLDLVHVVRAALDNQPEDTPVRVRSTAASLPVDGDEARLLRVIDTLLSNARKYSAAIAEVLVTLALEDTASGAWAVVTVQDQGLGIPATDLPRIFERFHRASNVQGRVQGTGLGLWGARQIVEQHGGRLTLDSREGVGTTVTIRLPLGQAAEDHEPSGASPG